jgi:multidrug efflux pump subunit AcrB
MAAIFYKNPRLWTLCILLIMVTGLSSYQLLPRLEDPELTQRFGTIRTIYAGASPDRVEALVTEPIEEELDKLDEIKVLESRSNAEISIIQVELRDDIMDIEPVWSKVRDKLNDVSARLPQGASIPRYEETHPRAFGMIVALKWLNSDEPNFAILRRLTEELEEGMRALSGTEETKMYGDPEEEILVEIDGTRAASANLTPQMISQQIRNSDAKVASGQLRSTNIDLLMEVDTELDSVKRVSSIPIYSGSDGQVVPLKDLATVTKGVREPSNDIALIDGGPAVVLGVLVDTHYRIDLWAEKAHVLLSEFQLRLPDDVKMDVIFDQSKYTGERLDNLWMNLIMGATAVMVVIFVMMGWKEALLVGTALPLSSLMVLTCLYYYGIPIHQMSVTGLIIALGLMIDNAIITVDEVKIRLQEGQTPFDAVRNSASYLTIPLIGSTVTTILSFAPIALMPGPAGEFVGSIAMGVIFAITCSLFVSLTLVITLTGWLLKASPDDHHGEWADRLIEPLGISRIYRKLLGWTLKYPVAAVVLCSIIPVGGFIAGGQLQEQFFPPSDRDQFQIKMELPVLSSLQETRNLVEDVRKRLIKHDEIVNLHWFMGRSAPIFYYNMVEDRENASNYAQAMVQLKSPQGYFDLIRRVQIELNEAYPQARFKVTQLEQGPPFDAPIEIRIYGPNLDRLRVMGDDVRQVLSTIPDVIHTSSDLSTTLPKLSWKIDEESSHLAGMTHAKIAEHFAGSLEGVTGGSVFEGTEELPVRVRVKSEQRSSLDQIRSFDMPIAGNQAKTVPLSAFADVNLQPEISSIPRINRRRVNIVQATITAGTLPQDVLDKFLAVWDPSNISSAPGYSFRLGGEAAERNEAVGNLMASIGILGVLMVATLVLSFGSFRLAGLIGVIGIYSVGLGLLSLWLFGFPFGFMAIIGVMGLVGIAINDSICVLSAIMENPAARSGDRQAMVDITVRATRHVIATTLTTIAGFLPLVWGGGGQWPPLAIAISGGVGGATLLGLFFVPPMYLLLKGYTVESRLAWVMKLIRNLLGMTEQQRDVVPSVSYSTSHH